VEDVDPLDGERTESGLMAHAPSSALRVEGVGAEGARDGLADALDEDLAGIRLIQASQCSQWPSHAACVYAEYLSPPSGWQLDARGQVGRGGDWHAYC
jgi:hypothetical protein